MKFEDLKFEDYLITWEGYPYIKSKNFDIKYLFKIHSSFYDFQKITGIRCTKL